MLILIPLTYTLLSVITTAAGVFIMFRGYLDVDHTAANWLRGIFFSAIGVIIWWLLEGKFGPWTIFYLINALLSAGIDVGSVGKRIRHGRGYGLFMVAIGFFWLWAVWHVYLTR